MVISLIRYNIDYYIKSAKYFPSVLFFAAFLAINYQTGPLDIWSNLHVTTIAIFIFANCVGVSFINSEDKTQRYITRLHVRNETVYHLSKIASIVIFLVPFYLITILWPMLSGVFARSILIREILIYVVVHFWIGKQPAKKRNYMEVHFDVCKY